MTPEFRAAIFKWEYDAAKDGPKDECIPFQLQSLFGHMTLTKSGSLTTEKLTKSFGWGNSEAFQQQDVQELCRVLFDCLEGAFKGTDNATLIDDLYQGEMVDYLTTIGFDYESKKSEKFLDVSLNIKEFGNEVPMNSVTESLESYLKPEKLEGDNQVDLPPLLVCFLLWLPPPPPSLSLSHALHTRTRAQHTRAQHTRAQHTRAHARAVFLREGRQEAGRHQGFPSREAPLRPHTAAQAVRPRLQHLPTDQAQRPGPLPPHPQHEPLRAQRLGGRQRVRSSQR
mmetsp:Transcript_55375/g.152493  ORF Transcript_55375/g.152493 Transcript_55375/m.152493 type:complete len:283 (+) Transcript_55375:282-1130(+)